MKRRFRLVTHDIETVLVIEDGSPQASITVTEHCAGQEVAPPHKTYGTLDGDSFRYADGTVLRFDARGLTWPVGSLLPGVVFEAAD